MSKMTKSEFAISTTTKHYSESSPRERVVATSAIKCKDGSVCWCITIHKPEQYINQRSGSE